jgi:CelD/BcsL family acetyltransferase involved in cellulose biosynthesis
MPAATEPLRTELVVGLPAFERLAPGWDDLVAAMPRPSPFLLHDLCATWWGRPGATEQPVVAVARRGERLVGVLPLEVRSVAGTRIASFPGQHASALADLLLAPDEPLETGAALLARLREAPYDVAWLYGLPGGSRLAAIAGGELKLSRRVESPVLEMPDGFDEVLRTRVRGDHRRGRQRHLRQLAEQGAMEFTVARTPDDLVRDLPAAFELMARRREGLPDDSGFTTPEGRKYYLALARRLGPRDVLRLLTLRLDGRPIAFELYYVVATTMVFSMIAFEPELRRFSPGKLAFYESNSQASAEGARRIELLGRLDQYKRELHPELAPLYVGVGLARGARGRAAAAALWLAIEGRRRARESERLRRAYVEGLAPLRRLRSRLS